MQEDKVKLVNTRSEWRAIPDLPIQTQTVKHKLPWNDKKTRPAISDAARASKRLVSRDLKEKSGGQIEPERS